MVRTLSVSFALLFTFLTAADAGQQFRFILAPTQVTPQRFGLDSTTLTLNVQWPVSCPCTLTVTNGAAGSNVLSPSRVLAGWVRVDGGLVLTPIQISAIHASATAVLSLGPGAHTIRFQLVGLPASYVTASLAGSITTTDLAAPRADHSATLMPDGTVLVAGGLGTSGVLDSTELIAGDASAIGASTPMSIARAGHGAALLPGGAAAITAGQDATGGLAHVELLNAASSTAGLPLDESRSDHTSTTLIDGRILILGGTGASGDALSSGVIVDPRPDPFTDNLYDPANATVTSLGSVLQLARSGHTATLLADGRVLVIGGRSAGVDLASIEIVDPFTNTSTVLPLALAAGRSNHTATLRSNGSILVAGGQSGAAILGSIEIVRAALNGVDPGGSLARARTEHSATMIRDGEILFAGGRTAAGLTADTELAPSRPADASAPAVVAIAPADDAVDVDRGIVIGVQVSEPLDPLRASAAQITLHNQGGELIPAAIGITDHGTEIAILPDSLLPDDTYIVTLSGVTDRAGLALPPFSFSFSTVPSPSIASVVPSSAAAGVLVTISGNGFGATPADNHLLFGSTQIQTTSATPTSLTFTVPSMAGGTYPISLRTRGGLSNATPFELLNPVPAISAIAPTEVIEGGPAFTLTVTGTDFVSGATVTVGALTLPASLSANTLQVEVPAAAIAGAGTIDVRAVNPSPGGGASNPLPLIVQPSGPPVSALTIFPRAISMSIGGTQHFTAEARYADGSTANVTSIASWTSSDTSVATVTAGSTAAAAAGNASITVSLGGQSAAAPVTVYAGEAIPTDPVAVAPELPQTMSLPFAESIRFLYEGENPIQRDVVPGAIQERRVAVVKGKVTSRDGLPLAGVRVTIADRPELGHTLTRTDGAFDVALNGGGSIVVEFTKPGVLPAERRIVVPSADFVVAPDVAMVTLDAQVTAVDLTAAIAMQVAQGSQSTDSSGTRQATVLFPQGTTATMVLPDGTTQPLTTMHVRATEYTVGPNGPASMPASLPPTSAYTYAVELSADEALAAGATSVNFDAPVPFYVENFLGFPIGAAVPTGYYDRSQGAWLASDDGVVIKILSIDGDGRAELDSDGDANPDDATALAALGITDAERLTIGSRYASGQSVWRVPITHFTPFDHNWPQRTTPDADKAPSLERPSTGDPDSTNTCETGGSIIECQDQVLGERLPIPGTPFTLNYRSDRVPGRTANRISIPLSGPTVSPSLLRIDRIVTVAGREFRQSFPPNAGQVSEFVWDGRDSYGRLTEGPQTVDISIQHIYNMYYVSRQYAEALRRKASWALPKPGELSPNMYLIPGREAAGVLVKWTETLNPPPPASAPIAGWTIDIHHSYQSVSKTVLLGDGRRRPEAPASLAQVSLPESVGFFSQKVAADQAVYYIDRNEEGADAIFRKDWINPPVEIASIPYPVNFVVDRQGTVYYADCEGDYSDPPLPEEQVSIYRIVPGSLATHVSSSPFPSGEGCDATFIARASDGTMFVDTGTEVFQLAPGGVLTPIGGQHESAGMAVGPDGSIYRIVAVPPFSVPGIERMDSTGDIRLIAGGKLNGTVLGGGGPALDANFGGALDIAVANDGSVLVASQLSGVYRLQQISPAGRLYTIAGGVAVTGTIILGPEPTLLPDGSSPLAVRDIEQVEVGEDGWIYVFGKYAYRFRPNLGEGIVRIAAEDSSEYYEFNSSGQHLRTVNALTGAERYTFSYDADGRLAAITDGDGLITAIERDSAGAPTAIVAPFGQTTTVVQDGNGWLSRLVAPGDRVTQFTSTASGLLTGMVDPNGQPYTFTYDAAGFLIRDEGPAGGSETLTRTALTGGAWSTTITSGLGRARTYRTDIIASTGAQQLTITGVDGTINRLTTSPDGSRDSLAADGTRTVVTLVPDPRFGLQAPVPKTVTITTPAGRQLTRNFKREVSHTSLVDVSTLVVTDTTTLNGRISQTVFTGATRTLTSTSAAGRVSTAMLDAQGRVTRAQVGTLTPVDFAYDAQGRLSQTTQGVRVSTIIYDGSGRLAMLTDPLTRTVQFGYDAADRPITQMLPGPRTVEFGYDANDNVTLLTPPGRPAHAFTFTPVNLTASYEPPALAGTGGTGYQFNADRQPTAIQRPDGQTAFGYDAGGRLSAVTFSRGTLGYAYDTVGRVLSITDPGGVALSYLYDGGLTLRETWSGSVVGNVSRTFSNDFDTATETVTGTAATPAIVFGYDADRLLTAAGALTIARDAATGLVNSATLGNTTDVHQYNTLGEPVRQTAQTAGAQVFDVQSTRDDLGRITQRIEVVDGITRVFQYGYDTAGRLATLTRNGTLVVRYTYDDNGNRLAAEGESGLFEATYDNQDRLLTYGAASFTYTANGELATKTIAGQTTSYVYDTLGSLIRVTKPNGQVVTYTVDGRGRRVAKAINGVRVKGWLYADQLRPIAELAANGSVLSRFVYGTKANVPEYMVRGGVNYRIISDHLGTPRVVINSSNGAIVQRFDAQPFGELIQDSSPAFQPFGFAGGLYDPDTGLIRFGARDYDPQLGRWMAKDPIGFQAGDSNLFAYVAGDPTNNVDPTGLQVVMARPRMPEGTPEWLQPDMDVMSIAPSPFGMAAGACANGLAKAGTRGLSVLGHYPEYLKKAADLGARRFSIPKVIWDRMSEAAKWAANQKFLDRLVARGDDVVLSTPIADVKPGSALAQEIKYLIGRGYDAVANGTWLIPPR